MPAGNGTTFPAFIRAEYDPGDAFTRFEAALDQSSKRARAKFDQNFASLDSTITGALTRAATAAGSIDLGVKQSNEAAAAASRRADALRDVARAARAAADAEGNVPLLNVQAKAAAALAIEARNVARETAQQALALDRLQIELGLVTVWFRSLVFHYVTLASKAKGLMPPRYEWRLRGL